MPLVAFVTFVSVAAVGSVIDVPLAYAAPAHVQAASREVTSGSTDAVAFSSANTAGNLIAVYVLWSNSGSVSVSDSRGNAYVAATPRTAWNGSQSSQVFYAANVAGGANTVTATFSTSLSSFGIVYVHEYSGLAKSSPVDVTASAIGSTTAVSSGNATTTNADDLLFGAIGSSGNVNQVGTGFTSRSTAFGNRIEDQVVSTTGSYAATARQNSSAWVAHLVAFKVASAAPDTTPPSQPTGLTPTPVSGTQINVSWTASTDDVGVVGYKLFRNGTQVGTPTGTTFVDSGLTPATTYSYSVTAVDAANNQSLPSATVSATTPAPDVTAPTVSITAPAAGATVSATVSVTATAADNVGVVGVQFLVDGVAVGAEDTASPYSLSWDTATAANGTHNLTARARDAAGNATTSSAVAVTVSNVAPPTPPTHIQAAANEVLSGTSNALSFPAANTAGNLIAVYVLWSNSGSVSVSDSRGNTYVAATPRTAWNGSQSSQVFYAANVAGGANTVTASFATSLSSFGIVYVHEYAGLAKSSPVDVTASSPGSGSAVSSGNATTTNANDLLFGAIGSSADVTANGAGFLTRSAAFGNRIEDRVVTTTGSYAATATQSGTAWVAHMVAFKAQPSGPADTTPPSQPTGLTATPLSGTQINLSWTASTDNVGVIGYKVFRNGTQVATPSGTTFNDTGLTPATTYSYSVTAVDAASNQSVPSATVSATTLAPDTTAPSVSITAPGNGTAVNNIVNVTADATDNVGVVGVQFFVDSVSVGSEDLAAPYGFAWDTRSISNGAHTLTARARDAAGNTKTSAGVVVNVANTNSFVNEILATGLNLPTTIHFLPDGRMLVTELPGTVRVLSPPYTTASPTPFLQLTNVGNDGYAGLQQGIFDLALDPNFATNRYFYVFYTMRSPNKDRLSRFTADATFSTANPATEVVLYQDPDLANAEHHGGAIMFGNDGKLYFTTGEHFDAAVAQDLHSPRGKVHRINLDGSVPTDNPFYDGAGPNFDSIWAYGLRNPYRAYYDTPTGRMFIGDVGGNDASTAKEELNVGARGANYGWPNSEGLCSGQCTSPIYWYPHNNRDAAITAGFVYHGTQYPSSYQGNFFFADYAQNWIKRLTFDANGNVSGVFNFEPINGAADGPYGDIVYLTEGPDGALYYLDLGYSDTLGTFGVSKIRRIKFQSTDLAPTAIASATPTSGPTPLTVNFSSAGSVDPENKPLTYLWTFGDGTTSTAANPTHTYSNSGTYTARVAVSDGVNTTQSTPLSISVGSPPTATILSPADGATFVAGDVITFSGNGTDSIDGSLPASAFTWTVDFLHDGHVHPGAAQSGIKSGQFTIPTSGHDFEGNTRYRITLTVVNSQGLTDTKSVTIFPTKVNLSFATAPPGLTLYVDGIARVTPFVLDTVPNFNHVIEARNQTFGSSNYTFTSWSDGGAQTHTIVVPATPQTYTATFAATAPPSTPTFVQQNYATPQTNQSTVTVRYLSAQQAGDINVIAIGWNSATSTVASVTDSAGNVYEQAAPVARGTGLSQTIWYAKNIVASAANSNLVTVTFSAAVPFADVRVVEYSGVDKVNPVDVTAAASGTSLSASSGSVTTTFANDLLFGAGMTSDAFASPGPGYTMRVITIPDADIIEDQYVTSLGSYSASATHTGGSPNWLMQLVAFRAG